MAHAEQRSPPTTDAAASGVARRGFVKLALGAAALGTGVSSIGFGSAAHAATVSGTDILNFLLNLHYLKANFYTLATLGLDSATASNQSFTGVGTPGGVTGGRKLSFADAVIAAQARENTQDELTHLTVLRATLGGVAVAQPAIEFTAAFTNLAIAAGLIVSGQTFSPFADDTSFLLGGYYLGDLIVSAYYGALVQIKAASIDAAGYLDMLQGIMAAEAYHAAVIRTELYSRSGAVACNLLTNLADTLAGVAAPGLLTASGVNITPADAHGSVYGLTNTQALDVVYGSTRAISGLFFPNGLNGAIR